MVAAAHPSDCVDFETSDQESSTDEYARRFSGPAGEWMLSVQEKILMKLVGARAGCSVLDVGGGHAQIAAPLVRSGFKVTVLGSSESCNQRLSRMFTESQVSFVVGNPLELPFPDEHFDVVTCFRLVSHTERWERLLAELKRVSKSAVIIDFPPLYSFNILNPILFRLKKKMEGNTRRFNIFTFSEIRRELRRGRAGTLRSYPQFFFPMVVHRALSNPGWSSALEKFAALLGLVRLFGSPVIIEWASER